MSKLKIVDKKSIKSIKSELDLLSILDSPYIVNMHYAFQDKENLYLVIDYLSGGDLRFHISRHKKFSEEQTRFFICGLILSLEYIHSNNIIHRDIKPENLVLEENGYLRVTDFGIAKKFSPPIPNSRGGPSRSNQVETSGTPGYMSPEVMKSLEHSFCADFFAVGVMGYEFMMGERPYNGKNRKEIKEQILKKQVEIKFDELNENWSRESADFINKLLIREPENRLGYRSINELKEHPWLKYYPWSLIKDKKLPSPFIPENKDNFDKRYCENNEKIGETTDNRYQEILAKDKIDNIFNNFYFNEIEDKRRIIKKNLEKNSMKIKNNNKLIINKDNEDMFNISKLLRKKIDLFNKKTQNNEKENFNINTNNINQKINKVNNDKIKTSKAKHYKAGSISGSKNGNMIYINFNINNNTNNNIIGAGNNINNFYISNNKHQNTNNINDNIYNINPKTERIKYFLQNKHQNDYQTYSETLQNNSKTNNNSLLLGFNGFTHLNSSLKKILKKKSQNKKIKNKSLLSNNLSKKNIILRINTHKNNSNNSKNNISLSFKKKSKIRHSFSHSFGQSDFDKLITKKINESINNTITINHDINYRKKFKNVNKIPKGRFTQRFSKNDYYENNKENFGLNSKQRINSENKCNNSIKNLDKNIIEIKYSIQEILNTDKHNINLKKMNYIYSKKSLIERKNNQCNSPRVKSNSCQKKDKIVQKIKNINSNILKLKQKGIQINIIPQFNKMNKEIKVNEEEKNKNTNIVEKIKVNKLYI